MYQALHQELQIGKTLSLNILFSVALLSSALLSFLHSLLCSALVCSVSAQSPSLSCRCCRHVCAPGRDTHYTAEHITPGLCFGTTTTLWQSATILHGSAEIRCVFTSMSWCWEGQDRQVDLNGSPLSPPPQTSQYPPIN